MLKIHRGNYGFTLNCVGICNPNSMNFKGKHLGKVEK